MASLVVLMLICVIHCGSLYILFLRYLVVIMRLDHVSVSAIDQLLCLSRFVASGGVK